MSVKSGKIATPKEMAKRMGKTESEVRRLCREGRIEGAFVFNGRWVIPFVMLPPELLEVECPLCNEPMTSDQETCHVVDGPYGYDAHSECAAIAAGDGKVAVPK
jgi:hypothetical protein